MRWCPSFDCNYAAKKKGTAKCICTCKCGHEFCFDCTEYWHEPVNCILLKQWKSGGDSETFKWIAENAKICPNCEAIIEKNGGCNHMVTKFNIFFLRSDFISSICYEFSLDMPKLSSRILLGLHEFMVT